MIPHRRSRGSPPRVRGKGRFLPGDALRVGITPAYAGKRVPPVYGPSEPEDHPRVCGEKSICQTSARVRWGSPPRMRGKVKKPFTINALPRITPAYAGKSPALNRARTRRGDHPRVCGEKCPMAFQYRKCSGSPPRMRGKVSGISAASIWARITPAYAGKRHTAM